MVSFVSISRRRCHRQLQVRQRGVEQKTLWAWSFLPHQPHPTAVQPLVLTGAGENTHYPHAVDVNRLSQVYEASVQGLDQSWMRTVYTALERLAADFALQVCKSLLAIDFASHRFVVVAVQTPMARVVSRARTVSGLSRT